MDVLMSTITFRCNGSVAPHSICDLHEAVGWDRLDWYYPAAFSGYWGTTRGFDEEGNLVAWCAILRDGLLHAVVDRPSKAGSHRIFVFLNARSKGLQFGNATLARTS
jgi:hypothetical protein